MKKYVRLNLDRYYEIDTSELGNDGIYEKLDTRKYRSPIYGEKLLERLNHIFSLSAELLTEIINEWAKEIKPDVDLEFYWSNKLTWFPLLKSVVASTLSHDLVAVQPMEMPSGFTHLASFNYSGDTPNSDEYIYPMAIRFINSLQNSRI